MSQLFLSRHVPILSLSQLIDQSHQQSQREDTNEPLSSQLDISKATSRRGRNEDRPNAQGEAVEGENFRQLLSCTGVEERGVDDRGQGEDHDERQFVGRLLARAATQSSETQKITIADAVESSTIKVFRFLLWMDGFPFPNRFSWSCLNEPFGL